MNVLNSDDFKRYFKKYQMGTLNDEEMDRLENELEKLDEYQTFLEVEMEEISKRNGYNLETERKILRRGQFFAYFRIGLVSIVVSLLLLPTLYLLALALDILP